MNIWAENGANSKESPRIAGVFHTCRVRALSINSKRKQKKKRQTFRLLLENFRNWNRAAGLSFQLVLLAFSLQRIARPIPRSCRRLPRLQGWWDIVWNSFDHKRFMTNFRITKGTFLYIIGEVGDRWACAIRFNHRLTEILLIH